MLRAKLLVVVTLLLLTVVSTVSSRWCIAQTGAEQPKSECESATSLCLVATRAASGNITYWRGCDDGSICEQKSGCWQRCDEGATTAVHICCCESDRCNDEAAFPQAPDAEQLCRHPRDVRHKRQITLRSLTIYEWLIILLGAVAVSITAIFTPTSEMIERFSRRD